MKKVKFLPLLVLTLLGLVSCKEKIEPQNPEIKLSEEQGKMLNLIFNLRADHAAWSIDFDTSSENYYILAEYSDIDKQKLSEMKIYQLQYCNGIITDMTKYKYAAEDGLTSKIDYLKIRWDDSEMTVTSSTAKCVYSLKDPDALLLKPGQDAFVHIELGHGIRKLEDGSYHFISEKLYSNQEDFPEDRGETILVVEDEGNEYLSFITRERYYSGTSNIKTIARNYGLPYKLYINGRLSYDVSVFHSYKFDGDRKKQEFGTYSYFNASETLEKLSKPKINNILTPKKNNDQPRKKSSKKEEDQIETEDSEIFREYDETGRLIYEKRIPEKQLYEGVRSGSVRMITKEIPDIKEFDKSLRQQIRIQGARYKAK